MGKYYCDYCDVFLVSESPSVRKAHNSGRNHLTNVRDYYSSLGHDKAQTYIDEITRMFESGGSNSSSRGGGGGPPGPNNQGGPPHSNPHMPMRPPFSAPPGAAGPNLPPFPPAILALMNNSNGMNSGPPPMRFAGPPIMSSGPTPMSQPPPGLNGYPGGPPPGPKPNNPGPHNLPTGMNPERARHLGLL